jgi:hypothetical protein
MKKATRIELLLRLLFIILSLVSAVQSYLVRDWVSLASAGLTILFLLLPPVVEKILRMRLPMSFRWIWLGFIIASMYLGELHSFFYRIVLWDIILHTLSAMLLAYIAFLLLYVLTGSSDLKDKVSPLLAAIFVFSAPVALGAVWELFEYAADMIFGVNMIKAIAPGDLTRFYDYQRGFLNSLHDLLMDALGALVTAACSYFYLQGKHRFFAAFGYLKDRFLQANPHLFSSQHQKP